MPTIFREKGFRFFFFSEEGNEPPHVHIKKGDADGKVWLEPEVETEYFFDFTPKEEKQIIEANFVLLIKKWYEYFQ